MSMIDIYNDKMVDMAFIVNFTGMTDKWFYKLIQDGKFPAPIKMGRSSRWLESKVVNWFKERINESRVE
ncbi:helix-turn-helix transcriptional regulator [Yersinia hibernica]|uniref:helix-turn-helix transcriptional regulator n=1 Tax=Yersinia hibernica TaxID=2339259 RepID=UPI003CFBCB02